MALWFAAVLGLIQGLTEFIPVSSTAHLKIARVIFGQPIPDALYTAYVAVLQLGTLAAVIVYFAKDLVTLATAMVRAPDSHDGKLLWMIAVGTLPIVVVGLLFKHRVENLSSLYLMAGTLIGVGVVMAVIDHQAGSDNDRTIVSLTFRDALLVGVAQTLALIPGVSRSGSTICMALLLGFARSDAARFSFLLSIPAVAGAGILEAVTNLRVLGHDFVAPLGVGLGVAGVTGYATIAWLLRWLGSHQLVGFAIYRVGAGVALLGAIAAGWLAAN
jgi:undecaprenyl-diphosphatase